MSDVDLDLPTREPPLDGVLDGYYSSSDYTDKSKLTAIKNVMKSAISITKSKTGHVILKTNRLEGATLQGKINVVKRERTFAEVDLNRSKIVFKAQYGKWMNLKNCQPIEIKDVRSRYRQVRRKIKQKELSRLKPVIKDTNSKWSKLPLGPIRPIRVTEDSNLSKCQQETGQEKTSSSYTEKIASQKNSKFWDLVYWGTQWDLKRPKTPQEKYQYSSPRKETVSRNGSRNGSRQMKQRTALWREETFDMSNIRDLLENQHLKQESLYCKHRIERWKTQMLERQKTIDQELKLTVTQREKTAVSIDSSDSDSDDVSSTDQHNLNHNHHQHTVFPDIGHKQTNPAYVVSSKDHHASNTGYHPNHNNSKSVTFYGRSEVVSMDDAGKRPRIKVKASASVGGDFNVRKHILAGTVSDRTEKRQGTRPGLGDTRGKTMLF